MKTSTFALIFGLAYLVAGLSGLIPATLTPPPPDAPPTTLAVLYGYLYGLFPVNIVHTLVHLAIGIWGIAAWRGRASSVSYARGLAVLYGVLAIMGMLPLTNTVFGTIPIHSHDIWLHGVTAVIAAYFGWREPVRASERRHVSQERRQRMLPVARERRLGLADRRERWAGMAPA
jgi:hypothetical protein